MRNIKETNRNKEKRKERRKERVELKEGKHQ